MQFVCSLCQCVVSLAWFGYPNSSVAWFGYPNLSVAWFWCPNLSVAWFGYPNLSVAWFGCPHLALGKHLMRKTVFVECINIPVLIAGFSRQF